MDFAGIKKAAGTAVRSLGRVSALLKTNPAAGLLTALAAGWIAGRVLRRKDPATLPAPLDK